MGKIFLIKMEYSYKKFLSSILAICLVFTAVSAKSIPLSEVNPEVVMISELFRHGARYTLYNLFNETDIDLNNGQLSAGGMREHYILGKAVKKAYSSLFADEYDHNQISIVSTHVNRTIESAQSHFLGMYDLNSGKKLTTTDEQFLSPPFNKNQKDKIVIKDTVYALPEGFRTTPIFSLDAINDTLLQDELSLSCPHAAKMTDDAIEKITERFDAACKPISDALNKVGLSSLKIFGTENWSGSQIGQLYDHSKAH